MEFIKNFVENNNEQINKKNENGYTILMILCWNYEPHDDSDKKIKLLLNQKIDLNLKAPSSCTALNFLFCANYYPSFSIVKKFLIKEDIDINIADHFNLTPFMR